MKKKYEGAIPFRPDGRLMGYDIGYGEIIWKPNYEFTAEMRLDRYGRGRSSVTFFLVDTAGAQYEMFVSDMTDMLKQVTMVNGVVSGRFTFCKKGANYGLVYLSPQ